MGGTHVGRQWETMRDKTSGRKTHHPTQAHRGRGTMGNNGRQGETMGYNAKLFGDNGRQGETRRETKSEIGDKTSGRRTHHPTKGETRGDKTSGRRAHHPTKGNKKGDKGRQDFRKADAM